MPAVIQKRPLRSRSRPSPSRMPTALPDRCGLNFVQQIEALVDKILADKKQGKNTDTSEWEREADGLVYELYGLVEEEIRKVEDG